MDAAVCVARQSNFKVRDNQNLKAATLGLNSRSHRSSIVFSTSPAVNPGLSGHRLRRLTGLTASHVEEGMQPISVSLIVAEPRI